MPFEFEKTEIDGLLVIKPHMFPDERGLYKKYYEKTPQQTRQEISDEK